MSPTDKEFKMPYFRNVDEATLMQIEVKHNFNVRFICHALMHEVKKTTRSNDKF